MRRPQGSYKRKLQNCFDHVAFDGFILFFHLPTFSPHELILLFVNDNVVKRVQFWPKFAGISDIRFPSKYKAERRVVSLAKKGLTEVMLLNL
jgi:hypothetical protein